MARLPVSDPDTDYRSDRLQSNVARFIVVVSVFGAVVSWQASQWSERGSTYDQQTVQDRVVAEQARAQSRSSAAEDLRLLGPAQQAYRAEVLLLEDARAAERSGDVQLARELRIEARRTRLEGDTINRFVLSGQRFEVEEDGALSYDLERAIATNDAGNADLDGLRPEETRRLAEAAHGKSVNLVLAASMLVLALFFLTLSQLGGALRRAFAGGGIAVAALGAILFLVA